MHYFLHHSKSCNPLFIAIFFLFLTSCSTSPAHIKNHNENHETSSLLLPSQQKTNPSTSLIPYENPSLLHPRQIPPPATTTTTTITVYNPLLISPLTPLAAATIRVLYASALAILRDPAFWSTFTWTTLIGFTLGQLHLSINATRHSSSSPRAKNIPKMKNKRAATAAVVVGRERTPHEPNNDNDENDDITTVNAAVRDVIVKLALLAARGFVVLAQVAVTVGKLQIAVAVLARAVDPPGGRGGGGGGRVIALPNLIT